MYQIMQEKLK